MENELRLRILESITDVPREGWNALEGAQSVPFTRWEWLEAMESSGSAVPQRGWRPAHLTVWRGSRLVGASPAWLKSHSLGEYVYDFGWAHAAEQLGIPYYPKLLVGVPLSPITSPRFLHAPGESASEIRTALAKAAVELAQEMGCSSVHVIFPPEEDALALEQELGFIRRTGMQYHWRNPGYRGYDDFLSRFTAKRRHQLRRERMAAGEQGIRIHTVRGAELGPEHAERAWQFYEETNTKNPWGRVQLTRRFFLRVFETMSEHIEVVEAERAGEVVAGAFNLATPERLFGRYWGCTEEHPFLHFHVCMYHSIDESIRLGRKVFEPGAGGEHKIARGFEPTAIHSVHVLFDRRMEGAVRQFVESERAELEAVFATSAEISGMRPWAPR
ncbi:MAG: GNAT family N-acetyltransferase [Myxococcaceae bacterium]